MSNLLEMDDYVDGSSMIEVKVEGVVKTLELPHIVWALVPHTFFIDAKVVQSSLKGYGTKCTKQALQKLCVDAIQRRTRYDTLINVHPITL